MFPVVLRGFALFVVFFSLAVSVGFHPMALPSFRFLFCLSFHILVVFRGRSSPSVSRHVVVFLCVHLSGLESDRRGRPCHVDLEQAEARHAVGKRCRRWRHVTDLLILDWYCDKHTLGSHCYVLNPRDSGPHAVSLPRLTGVDRRCRGVGCPGERKLSLSGIYICRAACIRPMMPGAGCVV